jgi:DNA polymerase-1
LKTTKKLGLIQKISYHFLDCPVTFDEKDYELSQPDVEKTDALFNELEFRRMAEQFDTIFKRNY